MFFSLLKTRKKNRFKGGFQIIEVVVGVAIFITVMVAVDYSMYAMYLTSKKSLRTAQASFLVEETAEVLRATRDNGWNNFSTLTIGTNYYLIFTGGAWATTTTPTSVDGFTRSFVLSNVYRDASDDIAASGTLDSGARKVTITVSWSSNNSAYSKSIDMYLFNI